MLPSVSKKDEQSYAKLETSLRKTRSHINADGPAEGVAAAQPSKANVTPVRPGGGGNPGSVKKTK